MPNLLDIPSPPMGKTLAERKSELQHYLQEFGKADFSREQLIEIGRATQEAAKIIATKLNT